MEARLQKWRNSDEIRIPSSILKTNDIVNLEQVDDKIIISVPKNKKISPEDRFEDYNGKNLAKEFKWDDDRGKEIW